VRTFKDIKLLAISFAYPPLVYARSIQVARLLRHLQVSTIVVCASEEKTPKEPIIESDTGISTVKCLRVPFHSSDRRRIAGIISNSLRVPLWNKTPDIYSSWRTSVLKNFGNFARMNHYASDILVTFGHPMSDHLIGLEIKKLYGMPWIAHFSDPWVDNPLNKLDPLTKAMNLFLERKVLQAAERLIFTSQETVDLVMAKYPKEWRAKVRVLPHAFDSQLYPKPSRDPHSKIVIRYLGNLYGHRTSKPLFKALRYILSSDPPSLADVCFEIIGYRPRWSSKLDSLNGLPETLVITKPPVNYLESLSLMASADGLLVIDAPAEKSVFLPSKLIDYIGASRPILGLTPPGAAATLIAKLGGWVADPSNDTALIETLQSFITFLRWHRDYEAYPWGIPDIRANYEVSSVAKIFEGMLHELIQEFKMN